jgi:hypothetical protein
VERLSAYADHELGRQEDRELRQHLETCRGCAAHWNSLRGALHALRSLPPLAPPESLLPRVMSRLEVEQRGPGLALLFRPTWKARPLIVPSLLPATFVFVVSISAALLLEAMPSVVKGRGFGPPVSLPPVAEVSVPRLRDAVLADDFVPFNEDSLFFETVVAQDGRVSDVTLLDGRPDEAGRVFNALRRERFEPAQYRGRPVQTSVYRLISRLDVHPAPQT